MGLWFLAGSLSPRQKQPQEQAQAVPQGTSVVFLPPPALLWCSREEAPGPALILNCLQGKYQGWGGKARAAPSAMLIHGLCRPAIIPTVSADWQAKTLTGLNCELLCVGSSTEGCCEARAVRWLNSCRARGVSRVSSLPSGLKICEGTAEELLPAALCCFLTLPTCAAVQMVSATVLPGHNQHSTTSKRKSKLHPLHKPTRRLWKRFQVQST